MGKMHKYVYILYVFAYAFAMFAASPSPIMDSTTVDGRPKAAFGDGEATNIAKASANTYCISRSLKGLFSVKCDFACTAEANSLLYLWSVEAIFPSVPWKLAEAPRKLYLHVSPSELRGSNCPIGVLLLLAKCAFSTLRCLCVGASRKQSHVLCIVFCVCVTKGYQYSHFFRGIPNIIIFGN